MSAFGSQAATISAFGCCFIDGAINTEPAKPNPQIPKRNRFITFVLHRKLAIVQEVTVLRPMQLAR
ncbi:hypothetical protein K788_00002295 [Paraburkholderia caribensis MBA4]|uniref:Uncharacterized protein n=1 Tax=Paraburkholderia caribensis MBA4 TaxID=1323664 RepID=A0A0P0RIE1_9BURK|nr:hypothetical protein K788_00002295 [Paraburkholderia caribensis MBA4]